MKEVDNPQPTNSADFQQFFGEGWTFFQNEAGQIEAKSVYGHQGTVTKTENGLYRLDIERNGYGWTGSYWTQSGKPEDFFDQMIDLPANFR